MLSGNKLEIMENYHHLIKLSKVGDDTFPNTICNFLVDEFQLQAIVLFNFVSNNIISVLGRSNKAKKDFTHGTNLSIDIFQNNLEDILINLEPNKSLQISEYIISECSILFNFTNNKKGLVRIAKETPFSQTDVEALKKIILFIKNIFANWFVACTQTNNNIISAATSPLHNTVLKTIQEFRNPINTIIGFASILFSNSLTSTQSDYAKTVKENAQNLLLTINDLIDYYKIETGSINRDRQNVEVKKILKESIKLFNTKNSYSNIEIILNIEQSVPNTLTIDAQKLRYIINNLFNFSALLSLEGSIKINLSYKDEKLFFVINHPEGTISSTSESNFFEPFEAVKNIDIIKSHFSGLTFTLIKKYVNLLGGNINIERLTGKGINFSFTINTKTSSDKIDERKNFENISKQLPTPSNQNLNNILVVEDDYATSKLMSNYLSKWGYTPTIVNTARQTLEIIEKEKFLAIIVNVNIPDANGLELLKKIHEHPNSKTTPTIVCSVEPEQQKAYMMGAMEYFQKPINYNYLVEVLTNYKLRKNSNILCVDDDLPTLNLIKQAIETAGFNAVAEHISANVIKNITDKKIDLAIIDLDMPAPNGFELIKLIKSEDKFNNLPIIIYTGKENFDEDLKKIDGLFEYLLSKKSTNLEDLSTTIKEMVSEKYERPTPAKEIIEKKDVIKILLAEDYKHSQIIVTRLLKKNSFENVVVADNGKEALQKAEEQKFDLILMDIQMPIMNGFEAMERLRKKSEYKDTPIIALTAFAMKGDREKCLEAGATDYIPKPIDSKEFIEKVRYYTKVL